MKYKQIFSLSLICSLGFFGANAEQSYIAPLAKKSLLLDIVKAQNGFVAVGERGHILRSQNSVDWVQEPVPTLSTLSAISTVNGKSWAVGHDAVIVHKSSEQADWEIQYFDPDSEKPLLDVLFLNESEGIAVGAYGSFYRTTDGGNNWTKELHAQLLHPDDVLYLEEIRLEDETFYQEELVSILPHLNKVDLVNDVLYMAGESGLLAKSTDFGRTWQRMDVDYFGSFFEIKGLRNGNIIAAGLRGNLFKLEDEDEGWSKIDSGITASINTLVEGPNGSFYAMGNSGFIVCVSGDEVKKRHLDDGIAITASVSVDDGFLVTSAAGLKTLSSDEQLNLCERDE
ncbi:MAG: YCF48-related protein [Aliiglaciecola sp.]